MNILNVVHDLGCLTIKRLAKCHLVVQRIRACSAGAELDILSLCYDVEALRSSYPM